MKKSGSEKSLRAGLHGRLGFTSSHQIIQKSSRIKSSHQFSTVQPKHLRGEGK